jgi:endonuclease YncB( thermonuclease family)
MIAVAIGYFIAGALAGVWAGHLGAPTPAEVAASGPSFGACAPFPVTALHVAAGAQPDYLPNRYSGMVVGVTDGDTIDVAIVPAGSVQNVRLVGIDAPGSAQAFGAESTRHLSGLVSSKAVTLECENERSYGRLIC